MDGKVYMRHQSTNPKVPMTLVSTPMSPSGCHLARPKSPTCHKGKMTIQPHHAMTVQTFGDANGNIWYNLVTRRNVCIFSVLTEMTIHRELMMIIPEVQNHV